MERELRRNQNLLYCVGTGVIMFGLWSVIKGIMTIFLQKDELIVMLETVKASLTPDQADYFVSTFTLVCIIIGIIIGVLLLMHICVGLSARKEGMGRRKKDRVGYLVVAFILLVLSVALVVPEIPALFKGVDDLLDEIVTVIVDVTSIVVILELIVTGIKVRILKRKLNEEEKEEGSS